MHPRVAHHCFASLAMTVKSRRPDDSHHALRFAASFCRSGALMVGIATRPGPVSGKRGRGLFVLHDLGHHGLTRALEHRAVLDQEFLRLAQLGDVAVDLRDHVARHHVPAAAGVFRIGPVVHEADDGADAAARPRIRFLMVLTRSSGVPMVEAAFSPPAVFSTASSGEVNGSSARPLQRADVIFVVPAHQAGAGLALRLFAGLGDVPAQQHAPVGAAHGGAVPSWRRPRQSPIASAAPSGPASTSSRAR